MYNKSKNKILFAIFILIILLIIFVLVLSVYNSKESTIEEEYKISLNNAIYDKEFSYVLLKADATLKKEWDGNYYLIEESSSIKYDLGTEPVFFDKSKNQVTLFGNVHQVFSNGETVEKKGKTVVNDVSDFQFFKLSDRKYLIIGKDIKGDGFATQNYLIVLIDKAGNATLLNNNMNIKTINPLVISADDIKFDVANEKLLVSEEEVDLKKINGSTNEYVAKEEEKEEELTGGGPSHGGAISSGGNSNNNNSNNNGSSIYNQIISQIINISGLVSTSKNKTNLYKNISLRSANVGASYIEVAYTVIDPEEKYLSVFLSLEDEEGNVNYYYLNKDDFNYRISGLSPNKQYKLSINYIVKDNSSSIVADSLVVFTNNDPTSLRITKINGNILSYKVKMYNEYEFQSAKVSLTDCESTNGEMLADLNIQNALSSAGDVGQFVLDSNKQYDFICLKLTSVKDVYGNDITINSYHKVKIK